MKDIIRLILAITSGLIIYNNFIYSDIINKNRNNIIKKKKKKKVRWKDKYGLSLEEIFII